MGRHLSMLIFFVFAVTTARTQPKPFHNLSFDSLAKRWDEALPIGNGWLGALIWQRDGMLRLSLDRVDLWDDRTMPKIDQLQYAWVVEQVRKKAYDTVQQLGDVPYERYPAPTKIPGAALEIDLKQLGTIVSSKVDIVRALASVRFSCGVTFSSFVHATRQVGFFEIAHIPGGINVESLLPVLKIPAYQRDKNSPQSQGLAQLGYPEGHVVNTADSTRFHQPTWNGNYYEVLVKWKRISPTRIVGEWTISNNKPAVLPDLDPNKQDATDFGAHIAWWKNYWNKSSVSIPDSLLEKQYYLEMYKFGCVARAHTTPISLQAIWTADDGNLPPWKGDIHNDLNTELSYWPGYASNHLDLTESFTNFLWNTKSENERWTRECFGVNGLNVPGVTTISGKPMGGWIQYSLSPTTVLWLAQHFYWQWKYSMDKEFFYDRLKPYYEEALTYLHHLTDNPGHKLPLSSSPEFNDNRVDAWFKNYTNYDLALCRYSLKVGNEIRNEYATNKRVPEFFPGNYFPNYNTDSSGLTIAPGQELNVSHRHMSPYMAIYPLCLLDIDNAKDSVLIKTCLRHIEALGTREWCGYSFSWMACLYSRAHEADNAVRQLQIFATNFCSSNSFHLNGDQKGGQFSSFTYRPFTLEGNFAFAQGVHELLLQTHNGVIEIFPAIPLVWKDVSFKSLRAEGAFLVSAKKVNGRIEEIKIIAEKGGNLKLRLPTRNFQIRGITKDDIKITNGVAVMSTQPGQHISVTAN